MKTLMKPGLAPLVLFGLLLGLEVPSGARDRCPIGQIEGAPGHCIWPSQCPDGSLPGPGGKCFSNDAVPQEKPVEHRKCAVHFVPTPPPSKPAGCLSGKKAQPRRVFLVGGPAGALLDRYLALAEEQEVPVSLSRLTVIFVNAKGETKTLSPPEMTLGHQFAGKTRKDLWRKALKAEEAQPRNDPTADAQKQEADLICGD